jgi:hypothetical protein
MCAHFCLVPHLSSHFPHDLLLQSVNIGITLEAHPHQETAGEGGALAGDDIGTTSDEIHYSARVCHCGLRDLRVGIKLEYGLHKILATKTTG